MEDSNHKQLVRLFDALGDETRYKLLNLLLEENNICVSELAQKVGISNAGVSQQLKILEYSGAIIRNRDGQKICYEVNKSDPTIKSVLKLIQH